MIHWLNLNGSWMRCQIIHRHGDTTTVKTIDGILRTAKTWNVANTRPISDTR